LTRFSVITPTFNRLQIVRRAIDSGLHFALEVGDCEVVVIDDASYDGTVDMIRSVYARELESGLLKLVTRPSNGGSTAAKSDGAQRASGDWLVFLDSDDELLPEASISVPAFIESHPHAPVFFFRCTDQEGRFVGIGAPQSSLDLTALLTEGTPGECLTVVSRKACLEFPPDGDPLGFEFLSVLRIVRAYGAAMLSDSVARRYHMDGSDRLTSRVGNLRRAKHLVLGFNRMVGEFGTAMPVQHRLRIYFKIACYGAIAMWNFARASLK
jgi:glycosyltransferase involved in cell wall biosynthesis